MTDRAPLDGFRILCVCTGNVFRSRLAEHYLRAELAARGGALAAHVTVSSAGTGVTSGRPVQPEEAEALSHCGVPPDARPSRRLSASDVEHADLVLCADRSHLGEVLSVAPAAMRRTFLLREFARVAGPAAALSTDWAERPDPDGAEDPVAGARAAVAVAARYRGNVAGAGDDGIADPWGEPTDVLARAADLIRAATPAIVDALVAPRAG